MSNDHPEDTPEREARIRRKAYLLWEVAGRPEGQAEEFWKRACERVDMKDRSNTGLSAGPSDSSSSPTKAEEPLPPPPNRANWLPIPGIVNWPLIVFALAIIGGVGLFLEYIEHRISEYARLAVPTAVADALGKNQLSVQMFNAQREAITAGLAAIETKNKLISEAGDVQRLNEQARAALNKALADAQSAAKILAEARTPSQAGTSIPSADTSPMENRLREALLKIALPPGAVVAFNSEKGCPDGWSALQSAAGRMVVGAGPHNNVDALGAVLPVYPLGTTGGEERHTLTIAEMPAHNHETALAAEPGGVQFGSGEPIKSITGVAYTGSFAGALTSMTGGSKPFRILPPFIALLYCEKNG
jgi:hypothetical protein